MEAMAPGKAESDIKAESARQDRNTSTAIANNPAPAYQ
jgi:hypothetical protein